MCCFAALFDTDTVQLPGATGHAWRGSVLHEADSLQAWVMEPLGPCSGEGEDGPWQMHEVSTFSPAKELLVSPTKFEGVISNLGSNP